MLLPPEKSHRPDWEGHVHQSSPDPFTQGLGGDLHCESSLKRAANRTGLNKTIFVAF